MVFVVASCISTSASPGRRRRCRVPVQGIFGAASIARELLDVAIRLRKAPPRYALTISPWITSWPGPVRAANNTIGNRHAQILELTGLPPTGDSQWRCTQPLLPEDSSGVSACQWIRRRRPEWRCRYSLSLASIGAGDADRVQVRATADAEIARRDARSVLSCGTMASRPPPYCRTRRNHGCPSGEPTE